jgi:uncharacterized protein (DUF302 family)
MKEFTYGFQATLRGVSQAEAVDRVTRALAYEGYEVVSTIDVQQSLAAEEGGEFRSYLILSAFNPAVAREALTVDPHVGLLLPCNVVIQANDRGDMVISIADPKLVLSLIDIPAFASVATKAQRALLRVTDVLQQSPNAA